MKLTSIDSQIFGCLKFELIHYRMINAPDKGVWVDEIDEENDTESLFSSAKLCKLKDYFLSY